MTDTLCIVSGYLLGSINPAYIISRIKDFDIRDEGTGNAGATNIGLQTGIGYGILALILDILKAFAATYLPGQIFHRSVAVAAASGIACILGHIYPVFMRFRGGKGTACIVGFGFGLKPLMALPITAISMLLGWLLGASTFVPVFASAVMILYYAIWERSAVMSLLMVLLTVVLLLPRRKDMAVLRANITQGNRKAQWFSLRKIKEQYRLRVKHRHK